MANRTVFISGKFNVLHPGHIRLLRFAKEYGDRLIVGLESDQMLGQFAHVPEKLRLECIQSNSWVDDAFIFDEPVAQLIARLKPDIVVKGKEHEHTFNIEAEALKNYGGRLLFSSGETIFSSFDLIRREFSGFDLRTIKLPQDYFERHDIKTERMVHLLQQFSKLKICVVGDLIVDEYITCQPLGMSQEDPTIVVTPIDSTRFIGGAGIVAAHAAGLGAKVEFLTVCGIDASRDFAMKELQKAGVSANLMQDDSRPTTLKQRYRSKGKSLLRVSHLHQGAISSDLRAQMLAATEQALQGADLLVFSDFNYGCLPQKLVDDIIEAAKRHGVMMAADSQSSSQIGDIGRFKGMDLLTPTEHEARISTRNHEDGLVVLADILQKNTGAKNIFLKLGEEGLLIHSGNVQQTDWLTDQVCALNSAPKDVAGAGDSLLIAGAMAMAGGANIWEAACMGALAAAVQVGRVGNTPIQAEELVRELTP